MQGRSDEAYKSVFQKEDSVHYVGVQLSKGPFGCMLVWSCLVCWLTRTRPRARARHNWRTPADLIKVVGEALKTNLTMLGPLVLPYSEQAKFLINYFQARTRHIQNRAGLGRM